MMTASQGRWLLPDGVDEQLPDEARRMEHLRGIALALFARWGYELCMPPLVEFLDSLLSGVGEDLETQTFKLTDQISGRMLGVPADITPQIARIDAHRLPTDAPQRLCYLGPVLHTLPEKFAGSRNPLQIGAELYGHAGIEADVEVQALMLALLTDFGIREVTLELCHMGIFRGLARAAGLAAPTEALLLDALLRKDRAALEEILAAAGASAGLAGMLHALLRLHGGTEVVAEARRVLSPAPDEVLVAVERLEAMVSQIEARAPGTAVHVDLAELRGYHYHTGIMFGAYTPGLGRAIAWGGRYDDVGAWFGRARPATGFSADMKQLAMISTLATESPARIFAPAGQAPDLLAAIAALRAAGEIVIQELPGQQGGARSCGCSRQLRSHDGQWQVTPA